MLSIELPLGVLKRKEHKISEPINSHHFVQRVEFTVALLHCVQPAVHQHVNLEDLNGACDSVECDSPITYLSQPWTTPPTLLQLAACHKQEVSVKSC